jgi:hypothetical protein
MLGVDENAYKIVVGTCEREYISWEDTIKKAKRNKREGVDWIPLTQERVSLAGSCDTCKETSGFVRRAGTVLAN